MIVQQQVWEPRLTRDQIEGKGPSKGLIGLWTQNGLDAYILLQNRSSYYGGRMTFTAGRDPIQLVVDRSVRNPQDHVEAVGIALRALGEGRDLAATSPSHGWPKIGVTLLSAYAADLRQAAYKDRDFGVCAQIDNILGQQALVSYKQ